MSEANERALLDSLSALDRYVRQLSACEDNSDVDVDALTRAIDEHLTLLHRLLPASASGNAETMPMPGISVQTLPDVVKNMEELVATVEACMDILRNGCERRARELGGIRSKRRVMGAYTQANRLGP